MGKIPRSTFRVRLHALPAQTNRIAQCAVLALTSGDAPRVALHCQMWARLAYEGGVGKLWEFAHFGTARAACIAFKNTAFVLHRGEPLQGGDLLYKQGLPGQFGHVGIYLTGAMVAENSSIHDTTGDARGLRTLNEFGPYTLAVRYPAPQAPKRR